MKRYREFYQLWHRFPSLLIYLITVLEINLDKHRLELSVKNIKTVCLFSLETLELQSLLTIKNERFNVNKFPVF